MMTINPFINPFGQKVTSTISPYEEAYEKKTSSSNKSVDLQKSYEQKTGTKLGTSFEKVSTFVPTSSSTTTPLQQTTSTFTRYGTVGETKESVKVGSMGTSGVIYTSKLDPRAQLIVNLPNEQERQQSISNVLSSSYTNYRTESLAEAEKNYEEASTKNKWTVYGDVPTEFKGQQIIEPKKDYMTRVEGSLLTEEEFKVKYKGEAESSYNKAMNEMIAKKEVVTSKGETVGVEKVLTEKREQMPTTLQIEKERIAVPMAEREYESWSPFHKAMASLVPSSEQIGSVFTGKSVSNKEAVVKSLAYDISHDKTGFTSVIEAGDIIPFIGKSDNSLWSKAGRYSAVTGISQVALETFATAGVGGAAFKTITTVPRVAKFMTTAPKAVKTLKYGAYGVMGVTTVAGVGLSELNIQQAEKFGLTKEEAIGERIRLYGSVAVGLPMFVEGWKAGTSYATKRELPTLLVSKGEYVTTPKLKGENLIGLREKVSGEVTFGRTRAERFLINLGVKEEELPKKVTSFKLEPSLVVGKHIDESVTDVIRIGKLTIDTGKSKSVLDVGRQEYLVKIAGKNLVPTVAKGYIQKSFGTKEIDIGLTKEFNIYEQRVEGVGKLTGYVVAGKSVRGTESLSTVKILEPDYEALTKSKITTYEPSLRTERTLSAGNLKLETKTKLEKPVYKTETLKKVISKSQENLAKDVKVNVEQLSKITETRSLKMNRPVSVAKNIMRTTTYEKTELKLRTEAIPRLSSKLGTVQMPKIESRLNIRPELQQVTAQRLDLTMQRPTYLDISPPSTPPTGFIVPPTGFGISLINYPYSPEVSEAKIKLPTGKFKTTEKKLLPDFLSAGLSYIKYGKATAPKSTRKNWELLERKSWIKVPTAEQMKYGR